MNSLLGIPKEFLDKLEKFRQAKERFLRLPPSHKSEHMAYITDAKKRNLKKKNNQNYSLINATIRKVRIFWLKWS
mgnify:CR=1 FL=1